MGTKIEWCNAFRRYKGEVWNPVVGCTPVSEGCKNCYAERQAPRVYHAADEPFKPRFYGERLEQPMHWGKPRFVFVCSMGDLFHKDISDRSIDAVMSTIEFRKCRSHIFAVLTKRAARMRRYMERRYADDGPPENLWLGVSVENQERARERVPELVNAPAALRFVSCEPLLATVGLDAFDVWRRYRGEVTKAIDALDWVLCGGESGTGARPMHPQWARDLRDQCKRAGVPYFFKQWGRWAPRKVLPGGLNAVDDQSKIGVWQQPDETCCGQEDFSRGTISISSSQHMVEVGKAAAGRTLDGREWNQTPEV